MNRVKIRKLLRLVTLSGATGAVLYTAHVVIGGLLWDGYSHVRQTVSELTATGAPNAGFLRIFTVAYGFLSVIFAVCVYAIFKHNKEHRISILGAVFLLAMEVFSFVGYTLFPLNQGDSMANFQTIMHIVVTIVVVICTVASGYLIGLGLIKISRHRRIGFFILACAVIITVSGIITPMLMANNLPVSGLTERINIFSLQTWIFALSVYMFSDKNLFEKPE
ncbi:MAG: DUF998 domain-containing protein [Clostridia bacterium]|nr:DUF998 domain-containing protein [Clostridia bacterium]MBN2882636.1 DUF998 domain-containing protein [Clostridia bacterium]